MSVGELVRISRDNANGVNEKPVIICAWVLDYMEREGYPPKLDEIAEACGLCSRGHAKYYVDGLVEAGELKRKGRNVPRGLRVG